MTGHISLCGAGLCVGYDGGDAAPSEYAPTFPFTGGTIANVAFDVADDERHIAAAPARD